MMKTGNKMINSEPAVYDKSDQHASKLSEEESRKMILESYEKAGVDLPLVSLETVLDREISEDDAHRTGTPRFRKFLNKASAAMVNRALINNTSELDEGPDDEFESPALPSSYTSNSFVENETPQETRQEVSQLPQTPERPMNENNTTEDTEESIESINAIPPTPESMKNNCQATFEFCCPKSLTNSIPSPSRSNRSSPSDKYVMSKLQLAEGFDDEIQSAEVQQARDVPALMDVEDSMMDDSYATIEKHGSMSKTENFGVLSFFRGSRRFRFAIFVCCLLHLVLIGLIIAFVTTVDNESYDADTSSSRLSQEQTGTTSSFSTNNISDLVTSKTLIPDPGLELKLDISKPGLESQLDSIVEGTNSSISGTAQPIDTLEKNKVFEEKVVEDVGEKPVGENSSLESCVNSLEVSMECVGEGSELLVYFESCTPRPGDWVGIYESSADPQFLLDSETVGWLYTCGDRFCEEAIQEEVLSFTRATDKAAVGTYRAHLIREGEGPIFSSIASSSDFRIVTDANTSC